MKDDSVITKRKAAIVTNNIHCGRHVQYFSTIEKYLKTNGWTIAGHFDVDKIILCSCGFHDAMFDKIKRTLKEIKDTKFLEKDIIIMGCLAKTHREQLEAGFKGQIIGFHDEQILDDTIHAAVPFKDIEPVNIFNVQPECAGENTKNEKFHIKISQGCLKTCTFCIINKAKGYITSIPFETIERQVRKAVKLGIKKIHLMGEDTFAYGVDSGTTIIELVEKIKAIDPELEISFGYLHAKWLKKYAKEINAFCKQGILTELQIGLQHIDEEILESMGRPIDFAEIYEMICNIKKENPGFYFIADILVGFPGETDEMFEKLMEFFKKDKCFNKVKHFAYSDVKGTPSSRMDTKLPQHVIAERWQRLDNNLGDRAYSTEAEEARIDNETFKKTRFDDYFFCKDTFDEELDGVIAQRELAFAQPGVLKDDEGDFGF